MRTQKRDDLPRPRRFWRRWRVVLPVVFSASLAVLLIAPFLLVRIPAVRDPLLDLVPLQSLIGAESRLRVARVERFDPFGVHFESVRIESRRDGRWQTWGRLGSLDFVWRPTAFLTRRVEIERLEIDSLSVDLAALTRRPTPGKPRLRERLNLRLGLPEIDCRLLSADRISVRRGDQLLADGRLRLERLHHAGGDLRADLSEATVHMVRESLMVSLLSGSLHAHERGEVSLDSLRAVWTGGSGDLDLRLDATGEDETRVRGEVRRLALEPARFPPLARLDLRLEPSDAVEGRLALSVRLSSGRPPRGDLALALRGRLLGAVVDTLDLAATGSADTVHISSMQLAVSSLTLEGEGTWFPRAGEARAELRYSGLDLGGDPISRFARGLPTSLLRGEITGTAVAIGPEVRVSARLHSRPGVLLGQLLEAFHADLRLDPDSLHVDSLRLGETPGQGTLLRAALSRRTQQLRASVDLEAFEIGRWIEPRLEVPMEGVARGTLRFRGALKQPYLEGDLEIGPGYVEGVRFASLVAGGISGTLSPPRVGLDLTLDRADIYGLEFDSVNASGVVGPEISLALHAVNDSIAIDLAGAALPRQPGWVRIDSLRAQAGSLPSIHLLDPARIEVSRTRVSTDSVRLGSTFGRVRGSGWIEPRPGHAGTEPFAFRLWGDSLSLAPFAQFLRLPPDTLRGTVDLALRGEGTIHQPRYAARLQLRRSEVYGIELHSAEFGLRAGELVPGRSTLLVDSLRVRLDPNRGRLAAIDRAAVGPQRPKPASIVRGDSLLLDWGEGWVSRLGSFSRERGGALERATLGGRLTVDRFPTQVSLRRRGAAAPDASRTSFVDPVDPMSLKVQEIRPGDDPGAQASNRGVRGTTAARVVIGGTGASPTVAAEFFARDLAVLQSAADSARLVVDYRDSLLTVERFDWTLQGVRTHSEGTVPMVLRLGPDPAKLLPKPITGRTEIPEVDLALVTLFTNLVLEPRGKLSGTLEWSGAPETLFPSGSLSVTDGSFRVPAREERITDVTARLALRDGYVYIEEALGKVDGAGRLRASGRYKNDKDFDLHGDLREVTVYESGNYRFVAGGSVWARPVADGDSLRPMVTGELEAERGVITMDLTKQQEQKVLKTPFLINLRVSAPENIRLVDPRTNLDLAIDSLRVRYRMPRWNYAGEVQIVGGRYRVFSYYFKVTSGTVRFVDTGQGPEPILDIVAETSVKDESDNLIPVTARVTGPAIQPTIALEAGGDRTADEVVRLLTYGQYAAGRFGEKRATENPASQFASGELWGVLEQQLVSQLPFFERVQVQQPGAGDPWSISIRPISTRQWNVDYTQELVDKAKQSVNVSYRLGNRWFVNTGYRRLLDATDGRSELVNLDLRFRLEY
ncbi:MAG: translocation/assembly module TamB domain-containing protein [Candidatus Eisenbacteria bacterium]|nr:translocation/assembly module TamB domain-containing protein [Candidatus Eisenbacteria bacterium]